MYNFSISAEFPQIAFSGFLRRRCCSEIMCSLSEGGGANSHQSSASAFCLFYQTVGTWTCRHCGSAACLSRVYSRSDVGQKFYLWYEDWNRHPGFHQWLVSRFGVPSLLTSDQGAQYASALWKEVSTSLDMKQVWTTAFHPQSNGIVECFHRCLKNSSRARWPLITGSSYYLGSSLVYVLLLVT